MEQARITINPEVISYEPLNLKEGDTLCVYLGNFTAELAEYVFEMLKYPYPNNTILVLPKGTELQIK